MDRGTGACAPRASPTSTGPSCSSSPPTARSSTSFTASGRMTRPLGSPNPSPSTSTPATASPRSSTSGASSAWIPAPSRRRGAQPRPSSPPPSARPTRSPARRPASRPPTPRRAVATRKPEEPTPIQRPPRHLTLSRSQRGASGARAEQLPEWRSGPLPCRAPSSFPAGTRHRCGPTGSPWRCCTTNSALTSDSAQQRWRRSASPSSSTWLPPPGSPGRARRCSTWPRGRRSRRSVRTSGCGPRVTCPQSPPTPTSSLVCALAQRARPSPGWKATRTCAAPSRGSASPSGSSSCTPSSGRSWSGARMVPCVSRAAPEPGRPSLPCTAPSSWPSGTRLTGRSRGSC